MNNLVEIKGQKAYTDTLKISEGVDVKHENVIQLIEANLGRDTFSGLKPEKLKTRGRPLNYYVLDEVQTTFLITLMRNSDVVIEFKERLSKEFYRQRQVIDAMKGQHKDAEWQQQRVEGKVRYMQKVDVIKQFVDYATAQGSQNAQMYYANLAKMENSALFFIEQKYKNLREILDLRQLMLVAVADDVIEKALKEGMMTSLHYKECYKLARERVVALAEVVGKSPVQRLLGGK